MCDCAEWHFRSSLDRYVWIHGMICAYMKPWAEGVLVRIDNMAFRARMAMRGLLLAGQPRKTAAPPRDTAAVIMLWAHPVIHVRLGRWSGQDGHF